MNYIFFQNKKTGIFKSHKEKYCPQLSDLLLLITEIRNDGGVIGVWRSNLNSAIHYIFEGNVIEEIDHDNRLANKIVDSIDVVKIISERYLESAQQVDAVDR